MRKVLIILLILLLAFIWGHSFMSQSESRDESRRVMEFVTPLLEFFVGKGNVTLHLVRKLAHFTEFFALGGILALLMPFSWRGRILSASFGLLTGFLDESIQMFSDRGDQIIDVWLDYAGVLCGILVLSLVRLLVLRLKRRRQR